MLSKVSSRSFSSSALARASAPIKITSAPLAVSPAVSSLKVIVNGAGSKSGPAGLAHLTSTFSFLDTQSKSALRLKRESEFLGGAYKSYVTRDAIVLDATFLKEDLPYFVTALGSVLTESTYKPHELSEIVLPAVKATYNAAVSSASFIALEELHALSFRKGLGSPLYFDGTKSYSVEDISAFAKSAFTADAVEIVSSNVTESDLQSFIADSAFSSLPASGLASSAKPATFVGAESRIRSAGPTAAAIGLPIEDASTYALLSAYLTSEIESTLSTQISTSIKTYKDASLFYFVAESSSSAEVAAAIKKAAAALKSAKGLAKFAKLAQFQTGLTGGKDTVSVSKFNYVAVGDIDALPFADEL
ncbi:unnamed protein product [Kuraishia capsulata CBS 1993]|uniref:Cytochrome b-c1 complex subunit 2, mitochondrial n=1 Tax=Kuraishia capsulata CBS 1993 TaxID=1382522 RepID=W6MII7_9ASCO|nr:uncharacterized protein KUCA_T00002255001 [Kuraishia capsulata CBS 1993]CDK26284.1 unnamed protein product [Kuraishia capsulata CBS 1993]